MASYQYIYTMQGLSKVYPSGKKVLENIHLSFLPEAKIGVRGNDGAGKSTLLRIMAGVDRSSTGQVLAQLHDSACPIPAGGGSTG
ncbi:putative ABC transporter ATP-binding protein YjjK [Enhygromyxa salina]|uniref:Putative ABC transporter ATP-binding protein YjjK n=1 Tax=Enhygromyxa salina TaxID=215803 RepID=A0A2S9XSH3_9BACT|nr:ATP-binding cassette domain-containing protein [Enhygromyxa salina]PRP95815.1 putative ABC transporter ATP-binding protein YjjK [Enhygromyxa salina]